MAKIPFSIDYKPQIESGEYKVETNDHHSVRIICWNKNTGGLDRIVALVAGGSGQEKTLHYTEEGLCVTSGGNKNKDLFLITPEPELSEWETFISGCLQKHGLLDCGAADRIAKNCSAELLALARKELCNQIIDHTKEAYENGKAEALKDMPRWKKIGRGNNYSSEVKFAINGRYLEMNDTLNDVYEIKLLDLEKLPKEN